MSDLVSKFVNLLIENNLRIVTAESITGGLIAVADRKSVV